MAGLQIDMILSKMTLMGEEIIDHYLKRTMRVAKRSQNQGATLELPKKTHMKKILQRHKLVIHGVKVIVGTGGSHS